MLIGVTGRNGNGKTLFVLSRLIKEDEFKNRLSVEGKSAVMEKLFHLHANVRRFSGEYSGQLRVTILLDDVSDIVLFDEFNNSVAGG